MTTPTNIWSQLIKFPNGEAVGKKMAQLLELSLRPGNEHLYPSVQRIWQAIEAREGQLLGRTDLEVHQEGKITTRLEKAMREASNEEWDDFKKAINLTPIQDGETRRIITDGSGLMRETEFEDWILGKETKVGHNPESL